MSTDPAPYFSLSDRYRKASVCPVKRLLYGAGQEAQTNGNEAALTHRLNANTTHADKQHLHSDELEHRLKPKCTDLSAVLVLQSRSSVCVEGVLTGLEERWTGEWNDGSKYARVHACEARVCMS